jgi:putative ABC transport system permease protein
MKFLYLVWRNLTRKKLRSALTVLSILVAFVLFAILGATKVAFVGGVELAGKDRIVVRHRVSIIQSLPAAYGQRIARIPGVELIAPMSWFNGIYQDQREFFPSFPTDPEACLEAYPEMKLPDDQRADWMRSRIGAIVDRSTAARFGWKLGQRVSLYSPIWLRKDDGSWEFDIVGIFDVEQGSNRKGFYFRNDYFEEASQWGEGLVGWYVVKVSDPSKTESIAAAIDLEFANSASETKAEPEGLFAAGFAKQIGDIATIFVAVLSAVFFTILLIAGNTMAQSVRERTGEIGVLKAMGYTDGLVLGVVLAESVALTVLGGFAGLAFGSLAVRAFAPGLAGMLPNFYLPNGYLLMGAGFSLALGVVAGILPAMQAGRLRIADALRRGA